MFTTVPIGESDDWEPLGWATAPINHHVAF
jgi:hypothetical protein